MEFSPCDSTLISEIIQTSNPEKKISVIANNTSNKEMSTASCMLGERLV